MLPGKPPTLTRQCNIQYIKEGLQWLGSNPQQKQVIIYTNYHPPCSFFLIRKKNQRFDLRLEEYGSHGHVVHHAQFPLECQYPFGKNVFSEKNGNEFLKTNL